MGQENCIYTGFIQKCYENAERLPQSFARSSTVVAGNHHSGFLNCPR